MPKIHVDFENMLEGRKAVEALRGMGYKDAHLDVVDRFFDEISEEISTAGAAAGPCLSALVLRPKGTLPGSLKGPLVAVDPMVSGMGRFSEVAELSTRLRVTVDPDKVDEVKNMLKNMGGVV
ncbi:MAG: hypothetical protein QHH06_14180 [Clostridiales bacterium]|jgi:hypothetical protein|nr:hypothetical protein [Eubacteriales bacterium]MDH7567592.1 hypothetical protein [Clostridiales bacterium]